jgi:lipopolysaccharide export system permease protein
MTRTLSTILHRIRPGILDRYVFRSFLVTFFASALLFDAIILLFDMMNQIGYFLSNKVELKLVLEMYFYKSFLQFTVVAPAAALFSAVYTISKMAKNNELIAIINSGMSIYRLSLSLIIFGILFSIFLVPFNDEVVFPSERMANQISDIARGKPRSGTRSQADVRLWGENGLFYSARFYDDQKKELRGLTVVRRRDRPDIVAGRFPFDPAIGFTEKTAGSERDFLRDVRSLAEGRYWLFRIEAETALYQEKRGGWTLNGGRLYQFFADGTVRLVPFTTRFFPFVETPYDFARDETRIHAMTTADARRHIEKLSKSGKAYSQELVEYYLKYSFPVVNMVIILIGVSFGGFSPRSVLALSFFIAIFIYLLYYTFVAIGLSLGKTGVMSPAIGAWLGNIVFFVLGCVLLVFRKT